jgi:Zn-dependent peptidase ImmA (M78 family)
VLDWVIEQTSYAPLKSDVTNSLLNWKSGEKTPTFAQIELVSKATHIPLGYFFLPQPPVENFPILQYRTIDSIHSGNPSRDLIDTINYTESVQEWMHNYMVDNDCDKLDFVGSVGENDTQVIDIADKIRKAMSIQNDWYRHIEANTDVFKFFREKLENIGVLVMMNGIVANNTHRKLNIDEFRAFAMADDYAPLIFINSNDSKGAKLFSLLHECVHIWLGKNSLFNNRYATSSVNSLEILCNATAAEVLAPNNLFVHEWQKEKRFNNHDKIKRLSHLFHCGAIVIARRALDNNYISRNDYQAVVGAVIKQFNESRKKPSSGGDYYLNTAARVGKRFVVALDCSVKEGKTQFTDAYRLTHTNRNTFAELVERCGRRS